MRNATTSGILFPLSVSLSVCEWLWHRWFPFLCLDFLCVRQTHARPLTRPTAPPLGPSFLCCSYPAGACMSFFPFFLFPFPFLFLLLIFVTHPQFRVWEPLEPSGSLVWSLESLVLLFFRCFLLLFDSTHTILKEACCPFCSRARSRLHTAGACDWTPQNKERNNK